MGGRSPLSTHLAEAVRGRLDEAKGGRFADGEMRLVEDLLRLQAEWSIIPARDELLIEQTSYRGGHHAFLFTLAGRLANEGLSSLIGHRLTRDRSCTVSMTANDYGFELLSNDPFELDDDGWRRLLSPDKLLADLLDCLNASELQRRHFREIARVAGLIFSGYPGQPKKTRHLQASSDLFFDVFSEFDPSNLLLEQARREVLDRELEVRRLRETLERVNDQKLILRTTKRFSPLAFPLWAEHMRTQLLSSERWSERIERMVVTLERAAGRSTIGAVP
jgi:ATP-dependent Lhr-like helicase